MADGVSLFLFNIDISYWIFIYLTVEMLFFSQLLHDFRVQYLRIKIFVERVNLCYSRK